MGKQRQREAETETHTDTARQTQGETWWQEKGWRQRLKGRRGWTGPGQRVEDEDKARLETGWPGLRC